MSDRHEQHQESAPSNQANATRDAEKMQARRQLLKTGWIAPVVFSVAANQAFAASDTMGRR